MFYIKYNPVSYLGEMHYNNYPKVKEETVLSR